ncbi:hypothetical protein [Corynebacterium coyleae]|uniref:hypothetical protein n=1 Tax=Corynebacterium coyleae TaxID=53374 RepID=UPI000C77D7A3|nr:hypothetical protein [Corynebacterium coyleae]PLA27012.1 hypothetical protein CYJ45_11375 [Corynebacterium coyleae]
MEERYESVARLFSDLAATQKDAHLSGYLTTISEQIMDAREIPSGLDALLFGDNESPHRNTFWAPIQPGSDEANRESTRDFAVHVADEPLVVLEGLPDLEKREILSSLIYRALELDRKVIVIGDDLAFHNALKRRFQTEIKRLKPDVAGAVDKIKQLESHRSKLLQENATVKSESLDIVGYKEPLEVASRRISDDRRRFGWIQQAGLKRPDARFPLTNAEVETLGELLESFGNPESHPSEKFVTFDQSLLPTAAEFASLFEPSISNSAQRSPIVTSLLEQWGRLSPSDKALVHQTVNRFVEVSGKLDAHSGHLKDEIKRKGLASVYRQVNNSEPEVRDLYEQLQALPDALARTSKIEVVGSPSQYEKAADNLLGYLRAGNTLDFKSDGSVRIPFLGHRAVRKAKAFLSGVRIDGKPPADSAMVNLFLSYLRLLNVCELAKDIGLRVGTENFEPAKLVQTTHEAFRDWFQTKALFEEALSEIASLKELGLQTGLVAGREAKTLSLLHDALEESKREVSHRLDEMEPLKRLVSQHFSSAAKPDWVRRFQKSLSNGDVDLYRTVLADISEHNERVEDFHELERLLNKVSGWAPPLADSLRRGDNRFHVSLLREAERARRWLQAFESEQNETRSPELRKLEGQLETLQRQTALLSNLISGLEEENSHQRGAGRRVSPNLRFIQRSALLRSLAPSAECVDLLVVDDPRALGLGWLCLHYIGKQVVVVSDSLETPQTPTNLGGRHLLAYPPRSGNLEGIEKTYWQWVLQAPATHISWTNSSLKVARPLPSKQAHRSHFENDSKRTRPLSVKRPRSGEYHSRIEKYEEFTDRTVSIYLATNEQVDQGILKILAVEGPILEKPLFQRYVRGGGNLRVMDHANHRLRASILRLKRRGLILEDDEERAYRLPDQPPVRPRTKGPRSVDEIPSKEWEAHLQFVIDRHHLKSAEEAYRRALERVGLERLTVRAASRIARAYRSIR